jgi:hypothetical protein
VGEAVAPREALAVAEELEPLQARSRHGRAETVREPEAGCVVAQLPDLTPGGIRRKGPRMVFDLERT